MKLKQFIFALVAMLLGFSVTASAQQLLVNCDYNSSTEGYGTTKFSNYAGAYAYATANATSATIVIEKTNTISGNCFDNNHKNYTKLAVVIKGGATMGNAASKWDMTYPVTVEPGGTLTCARPANASVSYIHIKNKLIVGAKGATKKAYVNFLSDTYQDCDISIRFNGSIEVYNSDFYVQDLDAQGKLTIEDSNVEVDGAFASATFYATTLTNSTITINGNQISGGLSDFSGGESNQLGNVKLNNSTLTIKEGDTKVAANVTATNSTIAVNNLTVNTGKTLNLNEASTLEAENITTAGTGSVKIDGVQVPVVDGAIVAPKGNDFNGYTGADAIWGEVWGNARESFVIKVLDANGNVMGTTSLNNIGGIIDGDVNVTWNIKLDAASNTDEYWTMAWTTAPTIDNMPAKVELWVDGVKVSGGNVVLNGPDEIAKIYAAVTDASGKILGYHTNIQEAIKAAAAVTSVAKTATAGTVEILRDVTVDKWVMFAEKMNIGDGSLITLNINGVTIDGNGKTLTVKSIESASNGGYLFYDAQNLTVKDLTINIADGLVGGIGLQSGTISNVTFNGGQYAVLPGKNGVTIDGCTFNDTKGYAIYYEDARPGIVVTGNTFNTAEGKYAITMRSDEQFTNNTITKGRVNLANSAASTVTGNDFGTERFKVYNEATATISNNKINNLVFNETTAPAASTFTADNTLSAEAQAAIEALPVMAGEGTEANPYTIGNLAQLKAFRDDVNAGNNYQGKFVKLTADIDLNNEEWTPIAYNGKTFKGTFDGGYKTIKNIKITKTLTNKAENNGIGLFGRTDDPATIKNFTIENVDITGSLYVGAAVGYGYTGKLVENVTVKGNIAIDAWWYAGVIGGNGYMNTINNCHVIGNDGSYIKGNDGSYIGGIWGFRGEGANKITNCTVTNLDIQGVDRVGGISGIGHYGNSIEGCSVNNVNVTATDPDATTVGIIIGACQGTEGEPTKFADNTVQTVTVKIGDAVVENPGLYGTNINGGNAVTNYVAKIGNVYYESLAEAVAAAQSGATITLMNGEHELPLFAGKELTFVGESKEGVIVNDAPAAVTQGWNGSTFHFENLTAKGATENYHGLANSVKSVTYKNCNINGLRFLYATEGVSFDGCAFNANGVEHSFWTYGASNVTVKNSTFTYTDRAVNCYSENGANHEADITFEGCSFTYAGTNDTPEGAVEINSGSAKSFDIAFTGCTAPEKGAMWFNSQWDSKNGENTVVEVDGEIVWQVPTVAKIGDVEYKSLQKALDVAAAGTGNVTVTILADVNLTGVDWNPVTVSAPGYPVVTVEGNGKTITGLNDMLFAGTWAGKSGLIIKDLTIENSAIVNDKDDTQGNVGVGAFIGFPQASATITLENCHLKNSSVEGGHWTGGLIGYAAGYAGTDGPVFMNLTIKGCSVTGSTITGKGSAGGIIGHGSGNAWTNVVIEETTVSGNTITSTGSSTNKAGAVMGTIGAAGQPTTVNGVTHTGGMSVSATVAGNTVKSNGTEITTIYGRQGTNTGMLYVAGGSYDNYPIEEGVAYAAPVAGYKIEQNTDGTYGVVVDPAYGKVAKIGETYYATIADAITAAQAGDEIVMLADVTEDVTLPAGIIFNGNGKQINGNLIAGGEITFAGVTMATNFGVQYVNTVVNIPAGASLQLTGTGRMVIGHGCTFNITGTIEDAKTADKATLTPSLKIAAGASITGNGVTFNVNNAYIVANANTTSKNKAANGTFNFNINNSIWDQTGVLAFYVPTDGMDPTVNFDLKNSVLTTTSHLVFDVTKGEVVIDNSKVNEGVNRQLENLSTMTIKNGSVVNGAVATSSNAKNPGTIIVENATYAVTGEFSGSDLGTGTLIIKKGATVSAGSITKANITIDATDMVAGDEVNLTANLANLAGELSVINNDKLEAKIVDGKIVLVAKPVAKIGDIYYTTLAEAFAAAQAGETITLITDIQLTEAILITDGMDVTIAGEGKTITSADGKDAFYVTGGKLTLAEGLNVHATTDCAIYLRGGDVFTAANLTKAGEKYSVIQGNGNYAGNVTITGGKVETTKDLTAIYWPQNGKLTITGGEITGHSAVYIASGSLEITGGTLHGVGETGSYEGVTGGSANSPAEALTIETVGGDSGYELISSVVISGGTFISDHANAIGSYSNTTTPLKNFISGGTFSSDVNNLCVLGYQAEVSDEGYYEVSYTGKVSEYTIDDAEGKDFVNEAEIEVGTLTYKRELVVDAWNPLYVPFALPMSELIDNYDIAYYNDVHAFDDDKDGTYERTTIELIKITDPSVVLKANYPLIIRPKSADVRNLEFVLTDVVLSKAEENKITMKSASHDFEIMGTYSKRESLVYTETVTQYVLGRENATGLPKWITTTGSLNPYRLILTVTSRGNEDLPFQSIGMRVIGDDSLTDIEGVEFNTNGEELIFDLQGRRVLEPKKGGLYIINGKKVYFK